MDTQAITHRIAALQREEELSAAELSREAVRLLAGLATDATLPDDRFAELFPRVARELAMAHSGRSPLLNAAGALMAAWLEAKGAGVQAGRSGVAEAARRWVAGQEADATIIADHAAEILSGPVLTIGYSTTVLRALELCWDRGVLTGVVVAESRPMFEGRRTAATLASRGIPVALIADVAMGVFVSTASAALVGADTLLPSGYLVARTGANLLALAAHRSRIPLFVLADTRKILPQVRGRASYSLEERDPSDVLPEPIPGVAVRNVAFDLTTARYITGYVTEKGLLNRQDIHALSHQAPGLLLATDSSGRRS